MRFLLLYLKKVSKQEVSNLVVLESVDEFEVGLSMLLEELHDFF